MSVIRKHHNKNYTVMSNYHFLDKTLSLKAKGLLSLMLSLPDDWDYSTKGLETLSRDGNTSVRSALNELEEHEYLIRERIYEDGKIVDWTYHIFESRDDCDRYKNDKLHAEGLHVENQHVETNNNKILTQSNTKKENKNNSKELLQNSPSFEFGKQKPKKESLYAKCASLIYAKTNNPEIQKLLFSWWNMLLEKYKDRGKVLYANVFKGKLNMLDKFDTKDWKEIIEYNLQKGYEGFYPLPVSNYATNIKDKPWEVGVSSAGYTDEEKRQNEKEREEMIARGERVWF